MSTPDVRVRLSPEGINEVIFALRKLQDEAKKARKEGTDGINVYNSALKELKDLLPAIGLGAIVAGFAELAKGAVITAAATGKMAESFGGTVEQVSALTLAFKENESNQDGLQTALAKTASFIQELRAGSATAIESLGAIGLKAKDVVNLSTPEAFALISKNIAAIPPNAGRAGAAIGIFSKQTKDLLPAIVAVGEEGIDPFIAKAKELGVLVDGELVRAAKDAKNALELVKIQAEGLATQFVAGLAPAISDVLKTLNEATSGSGGSSFKTFGDLIGTVLRGATYAFILFGKFVGAIIADMVNTFEELIDKAKAIPAALKGDFSGFQRATEAARGRRDAIAEGLKDDLNQAAQKFTAGPELTPEKPAAAAGAGGSNDIINQQEKKAAEARAAAQKAALENELKIQQEGIKSKSSALQESYAADLISLEDYYNKRRALTQQQTAIELKSLQLQRDALTKQLTAPVAQGGPEFESDRIKIEQQIATIDAQISTARLTGARELKSLDNDRLAARQALAKEETTLANTLDELENKRHEVFQRNLQNELADIADLGTKAGQSVEEIQAAQKRLSDSRTAGFNFNEASLSGNNALNDFQNQADKINRDQQAGVLSQVEAEQKLIDLEKQRLGVLQQLSAELLAAAEATGNQDSIDRAKQFAASIDQIRASYQAATDVGSRFKSGVADTFEQGISSMLQNADKISSIGDAFRQLGLSIAQTLEKIAADIIAKQAVLALIHAFSGSSSDGGTQAGGSDIGSFVSALGGAFAKDGGHIVAMADGGDVRGRELPIAGPDKIPILAQAGEFMVRRAKVMEPGALNFLRSWNGGHVSLAQAMKFPRFATGGNIGPAVGTPGQAAGGVNNQRNQNIRVVNVLDPTVVTDALTSASGEQTIMNTISRNSASLKRLLK